MIYNCFGLLRQIVRKVSFGLFDSVRCVLSSVHVGLQNMCVLCRLIPKTRVQSRYSKRARNHSRYRLGSLTTLGADSNAVKLQNCCLNSSTGCFFILAADVACPPCISCVCSTMWYTTAPLLCVCKKVHFSYLKARRR